MKKTYIFICLMLFSSIRSASANPVPMCEIHHIKAFPPEIGIYFNLGIDISGFRINTSSGVAVVDSGIIGSDEEFMILDSTNTSGFVLNPEADSVVFEDNFGFELDYVYYGYFDYAPPPIRGHSIYLHPYCRGYHAWSFDFSRSCFGLSEIIINEVNAHCLWSPEADFIELYNRGDTAINLEGWKVVCDTIYELPSEAVILPQGFYAIDDIDVSANFDMDLDADNIYLINAGSYLVDQVGWSSDHGQNISFMRFPDGDADSTHPELGYMGYDDESSYTFENGFPTRGAPNRHQSPGFVVIGTRAIGGDARVDLHWTNPIWDEEYNASMAVRSFDHFPESPDDGDIVYQGDGQYVRDVDLPAGQWIFYTVFARNNGGEYSVPTYESRDSVMLSGVGIMEDVELPHRISYLRSYPNPFNATATLQYNLLQSSGVTIEIYNIVGQRVATMFEGIQQAGEHSITWNASGFPSGIYFARLEAGNHSKSMKMVLLK